MIIKRTHCLRLSLSFLLVCDLFGASIVVNAQQKKADERVARNKNACLNSEQAKFIVKCKDRYFLGETPTITISITNTGRSPMTVKDAEHQKFFLEINGDFPKDSGQATKKVVYDGSWDLSKQSVREPKPGEVTLIQPPPKRETKYVTLAPGESTNLTLDLARTFGSRLAVNKYKLVVKSEEGQKVVKEFEVYLDDEKSVPLLGEMLKSDDVGERNWAVSNLAQYNRPKLITLFEELVKSGNEKQRDFASEMLTKTKAGWFDHLKLRVENKDRYFLGEAPILAISIVNASSTVQTVKPAQYQKFSLELSGMFGSDGKQETRTCVYDGGKEDTSKQSAKAQSQRHPQVIKLSELESTSLSLNLFECFHLQLGVGKYELTVKSADEQLKNQMVVKKFEVHAENTSRGNQ